MLIRRALSIIRHPFSTSKFAQLLELNDPESLQQAADMLAALESQQVHLKAKIDSYKTQLKSYKLNSNVEKIRELMNYIHQQQNQNKLVLERSKRELQNANKYAVTRMAKELVEVADNLKKCIQQLQKTEDTHNAQLDEAHQLLVQSFHQFGIREFDPIGQKYDPNVSEAIFQIPDDTKESGTVGATTQTGYMIHERVLRSAKVGVYKK